MNAFDIDSCLKSMTVLVDSRERPTGEKSKRRYEQFKCSWRTATLDYGDYTYNFALPDGSKLFPNLNDRIQPHVVVERKMNLDELAGNFCERLKDSPDAKAYNQTNKTKIRNRFEFEFVKAKQNNAKVYLLVEDATYENMYAGRYRSRLNAKSFVGSLWSFSSRYNITPVFCKSETSGKIIHDILYYELRKRLESGVYG